MQYTNLRILGLLVITFFSSSAFAANEKRLTPQEAAIVRMLDYAARQDQTLKSLSNLPWASNAMILRPEIVGRLAACQPAQGVKDGGLLIVYWNQVKIDDSCGKYGYYASLKLRSGQIDRLTFGESEIILTSKQ